jgi:hypothetical protein
MRIYAAVNFSGATLFRHASITACHISIIGTVTYLLSYPHENLWAKWDWETAYLSDEPPASSAVLEIITLLCGRGSFSWVTLR